jgi:hypothetical protein
LRLQILYETVKSTSPSEIREGKSPTVRFDGYWSIHLI